MKFHWLLLTLMMTPLACRSAGEKHAVMEDAPYQDVSYEDVSHEPVRKVDYRVEGPDGSDAQSRFQTTSSGLKYRILRRGNGKKPTEYDRVKVSYRGWLDDGTEFDTSYKRGKPIIFKLKQVVPGWTEGMQYVSEGGKIELEIPSDLGYGLKGQPPSIPPAARLHFIVELHEVY